MLLFYAGSAFSFENISVPAQNSGYSTENNEQNTISAEEFDILEKKIFRKTFGNDSAKNRLSRLEKELFGMEQKGNEEERFENLITASDYYQSGYRQAQSRADAQAQAKKKNEINPRDYIVNYNFDDNDYKEEREIPKYKVRQEPYSSSPVAAEPVRKKSKIIQFFEDIANAVTSGAVTGYTLPIDSFGIDPFGINNFGGTNYIGVPQFPTYYPQSYVSPYRYNRTHYPYVSGYNRNYPPPPPKYNYNRNPYGVGRNNYNTGSGVRIIH